MCTLHQRFGNPFLGKDVPKPSTLMGEHHAEYAATWLVQMTVDSGSCKMCGGKTKGRAFFPVFYFYFNFDRFLVLGRKHGKERKGNEGKGRERKGRNKME